MHDSGGRAIRATRALVLVSLAFAPAARGGEWHVLGSLICSDCHTMHNSQQGQPMRYDAIATPGPLLLRAADATSLCLACHGGANPTSQAPSVAAPSNGDPPGGGFPADLTDPAHRAHALGPLPVTPPDGDTAVVMTCVTCHAPHGNAAYRNLVASPSGTGRSTSAPAVAQLVLADGTNAAQVYTRSNVRYASGMSQWCLDCHNALTEAHAAAGEVPPHPWDRPIFGAASADFAAWSGTIPDRVAVQNAAGLGATPPDAGDQVFCLSCHKAHGSPNPATLVYAGGAALSDTCQQCHNM